MADVIFPRNNTTILFSNQVHFITINNCFNVSLFENLPGLVRLGNASVDVFSKFQTINNFGNLSAVHPSIEESRKLLQVIFRDLFSDFSSRLTSLLKMPRYRTC